MDVEEGTIDLLKHFDLLPYIDVLQEIFQKLIAQGGLSSKHIPYWFTLDNLLYYADIDEGGVMKIHLPSTTKSRGKPQSKFSSTGLKLRDETLPAPTPETSRPQAPAKHNLNPCKGLTPKLEQVETPVHFPAVQPAPVNPIEPTLSPPHSHQVIQTHPANPLSTPGTQHMIPPLEVPAHSKYTEGISAATKKVCVKKEQHINTIPQRYITSPTQIEASNAVAVQPTTPPDIQPSSSLGAMFDEAQGVDALLDDSFFNFLEAADLSEPAESANTTGRPMVSNPVTVATPEITDTSKGIFASSSRDKLPQETQKVKKESITLVNGLNQAPLISASIKKEPDTIPTSLSKSAGAVKKEPQDPRRISQVLTPTTCQPPLQNFEHSNLPSHPPSLALEPAENDTGLLSPPIAFTKNSKGLAPKGSALDPFNAWKERLLLKAQQKTALAVSSGPSNAQGDISNEQSANLKNVSDDAMIPQAQKEPIPAEIPESFSQAETNTKAAVQTDPIKNNNMASFEGSRLKVTQVFLHPPRHDFLNNQGFEQQSRPSILSRLSFAPAGSQVGEQPSAFASSQKPHAQKNSRGQQNNDNVRYAPSNRLATSKNHSLANSTLNRVRLNPAFNKAIAELRTYANPDPNSSAQREHPSSTFSRLETDCNNISDKHSNRATTSKTGIGGRLLQNLASKLS
ncbi:hypothetical protein DSO57_1011609 [Entomophthora muscae]|uniref:Uncharacterized protein n=1 Tax=Entomophthora muscae TaxID=34485 RepID=A0ACC2URI6_9FUNG|nr:hypothetical protein DSO57_1011609 [Entomophthora muscae]